MKKLDKSIRQAIYFLVITLVINAGGWTFNKEAVADVWFNGQQNLAVDSGHASVESACTKTVSPKSSCNHWCYAVGHFVGLFSHLDSVTFEFANEYSAQRCCIIQSSFPDGRFRPPQLLS